MHLIYNQTISIYPVQNIYNNEFLIGYFTFCQTFVYISNINYSLMFVLIIILTD